MVEISEGEYAIINAILGLATLTEVCTTTSDKMTVAEETCSLAKILRKSEKFKHENMLGNFSEDFQKKYLRRHNTDIK